MKVALFQVEEGGAKVGRDFTHSSAALLQFDPGVNIKTWNIFPIDDGLEENHESFTVHLKNPRNSVLGTRTSARVEILDPRQGRCEPFESFEDFVPLVPPGPIPEPVPDPNLSPGPEKESDPVTEIETELIFEPDPQSPRRGDVPNRELDFSLRDQAWTQNQDWAQDQTGLYQDLTDQRWSHVKDLWRHKSQVQSLQRDTHRGQRVHVSTERGQERVWTFHGLTTPLRVEQIQEQPLRDAPSPPEGAALPHAKPEGTVSPNTPLESAIHPDTQLESTSNPAKRGPGSFCPSSWTLHRGRCFLLSPMVASWSSAHRSCSQLFNSSLASVQTRRDLSWFWKFSGRRPFWIDFSDVVDSDVMALSDLREALSPHCVLVKNPKNWIQTDCSTDSQHVFICSKPVLNQD
ncbi:hypothetical protein WMY93_024766 [Mugilogobius chulae]|uniref:C-type lectin domain-containing protein n=1 Tax=Mugilogobius chulae TaxID=88201 RepID=A0AAW0ND33_9GOBI